MGRGKGAQPRGSTLRATSPDIAPCCTVLVPINCLVPPALGSCCLGGGVGVPPGLLAARQPRRRLLAPRRALGSPTIPVPRHATPQRRLLKRVAGILTLGVSLLYNLGCVTWSDRTLGPASSSRRLAASACLHSRANSCSCSTSWPPPPRMSLVPPEPAHMEPEPGAPPNGPPRKRAPSPVGSVSSWRRSSTLRPPSPPRTAPSPVLMGSRPQ